MASRYKHNYKAFDLEVLCAGFMVEEMRTRAERVKEVAEATAPDATPLGVGYKYQFSVTSGIRTNKTTRAFGRVTNDSPHAIFVEFGSGEHTDKNGRVIKATPAHRTLGRALDAAG